MLFLSQVEAYNKLSPEFCRRLEGLRVVHSAVEQADHPRKGWRFFAEGNRGLLLQLSSQFFSK